ncbi:MAG: 2-(1,2-epoxy-1,2-dihydrophenyl)acetyl-CoA isomerase PaaG [Gammaproteobacteria bacterium]|nr:2-(1,2-epoxy-1,2-dihydrophenyl)acetyl-CoA isomerase PaaG [Gammaproteobacteria bacterium]
MAYNTIELLIEDGLAILTLNRPETLNSFTNEMHAEVRDALRTVGADQQVRCLMLTGNGRGFCAGQDLADLDMEADIGELVEKNYNVLINTLTHLEVPVICAVNGVAAGAGANIAFACDIVLAARSASFIQSFCKIGLIPDSGGTWRLPRLVGMARAKGLAMLGDKLSAEQAEEWGLIWKCVDAESLMEEAVKLGKHLVTQPTRGLALTKQALHRSSTNSLDQQLQLEKEFMSLAGQTHDYREAVQAFIEKRQPVFTGK